MCEWVSPVVAAGTNVIRFSVMAWAAVRIIDILLMKVQLGH